MPVIVAGPRFLRGLTILIVLSPLDLPTSILGKTTSGGPIVTSPTGNGVAVGVAVGVGTTVGAGVGVEAGVGVKPPKIVDTGVGMAVGAGVATVVGVEVPIGVSPGVWVDSGLREAEGVGGLKIVGNGVEITIGVGDTVGLGDNNTGTMRATNATELLLVFCPWKTPAVTGKSCDSVVPVT